jgi:hypothetical protein
MYCFPSTLRPQLDCSFELPLRLSLDEMVRLGNAVAFGDVLKPSVSHGSWHSFEFHYPLLDPCIDVTISLAMTWWGSSPGMVDGMVSR